MSQLETIKYYRSYAAGQTMLWADDTMEYVASIITGVATISQSLEDGRRQMVGLLLPSDFIGRPGRETAPFDVVAVTDVSICCFRRRPFEKLLQSTPNIGQRLLEMSLDELDAAREWMLLLGRKTAREKIASLLEIFARRDAILSERPISGEHAFVLPLTRESMADYLGLTLETVSRQMSALRREGVIRTEGKWRIVIPEIRRIARIAGRIPD